jgi:hypothetical protein
MMLLDGGLDELQREIAGASRQVRFTDGIGRSHQPGFRLATSGEMHDAAETAEGAREIRKRVLQDAWRTNMAHAAALKSVASDIEGHAQEEADREDADATAAKTFTKKWQGAFEADDAGPDHPQPDSDAAYQASKIVASNRWKTNTARVAENYDPDLVRRAAKFATVLNVAKPYERTMTANLAVQASERELAARKSHDAITTDAISAMTERAENAWRQGA